MAQTPTHQKIAAVGALMEGTSLRATSRITGLSRERLSKLVLQMGRASERLMDEKIRGFSCEQIEMDELWTFCLKRRNRVKKGDSPEAGDAWVWSAVDPDSKLIPAHFVGKRTLDDAHAFAQQLRRRVEGRVQLNTDRLHAYRSAILGEFSERAEDGTLIRPDWASIVKHYEPEPLAEGRYAPPRCVDVDKRAESGNPDLGRATTSHVEAHHLHFRMRNKRATRLGNAFSKSLTHLRAATQHDQDGSRRGRRPNRAGDDAAGVCGVGRAVWALGLRLLRPRPLLLFLLLGTKLREILSRRLCLDLK